MTESTLTVLRVKRKIDDAPLPSEIVIESKRPAMAQLAWAMRGVNVSEDAALAAAADAPGRSAQYVPFATSTSRLFSLATTVSAEQLRDVHTAEEILQQLEEARRQRIQKVGRRPQPADVMLSEHSASASAAQHVQAKEARLRRVQDARHGSGDARDRGAYGRGDSKGPMASAVAAAAAAARTVSDDGLPEPWARRVRIVDLETDRGPGGEDDAAVSSAGGQSVLYDLFVLDDLATAEDMEGCMRFAMPTFPWEEYDDEVVDSDAITDDSNAEDHPNADYPDTPEDSDSDEEAIERDEWDAEAYRQYRQYRRSGGGSADGSYDLNEDDDDGAGSDADLLGLRDGRRAAAAYAWDPELDGSGSDGG